jgi:hypothetical protein
VAGLPTGGRRRRACHPSLAGWWRSRKRGEVPSEAQTAPNTLKVIGKTANDVEYQRAIANELA